MKVIETKRKVDYPTSATILAIIGWLIIIVAFIVGIICGRNNIFKLFGNYKVGFSFITALIVWVIGIIPGTILIALGNILNLLTDIANKDYISREID